MARHRDSFYEIDEVSEGLTLLTVSLVCCYYILLIFIPGEVGPYKDLAPDFEFVFKKFSIFLQLS